MAVAQDYTTLALDGTEQTVYEGTNETKIYSGRVFLSLMGASDTVVLKVRMWDGAAYQLYDTLTYTGSQTNPVRDVPPLEVKGASGGGFKVTAQRTAGPVASIKSIWFKH